MNKRIFELCEDVIRYGLLEASCDGILCSHCPFNASARECTKLRRYEENEIAINFIEKNEEK